MADKVAVMASTISVMCQSLKEAAAYMADYANRSLRAVDMIVGSFAWLSTAHLRLSVKLSWKLAARWPAPSGLYSRWGPFRFTYSCRLASASILFFIPVN